MKAKNLKIARRALILAIALFGAASQGNEVEAFCSVKSGGVIYRCRGSEGSCHMEIGSIAADCEGSEFAVMVLKEEMIKD